jgi:hypothetical protein
MMLTMQNQDKPKLPFKVGQPTVKPANATGGGHYGEPIKDIIDIGGGVQLMITGTDGDLFEIWRQAQQLLFHRIQDVGNRPLSRNGDVGWVSVGSDFNVAVRAGKDRDIFFCYAIRGNTVYPNPPSGHDWPAYVAFRWGKGHPDWTNYTFNWNIPNTLEVVYQGGLGLVDWDDSKKAWHCRNCDP